MSVFKRGNKWQYDFWVKGKRYRGPIPEARVKAHAERAETTIRDQVYEGKYGKGVEAPFYATLSPTPSYPGLRSTSEPGEKMFTGRRAYWLSSANTGWTRSQRR